MIFQYLQEKLQRFLDYRVLWRIVQATEKIFGCRSNRKKNLLCNFTMLQKQRRKRLVIMVNQTEHLELNSFTNMVGKIDIDALKAYD